MTKKHFIALATMIKDFNEHEQTEPFTAEQLGLIADFFRNYNPSFNRQRWLDYIDGKCGPNGGKVE